MVADEFIDTLPQAVEHEETGRQRPSHYGRKRETAFVKSVVKRLWSDERGQDLLEYALLASIIATAGVLVLPALGDRLGSVFTARETPVYDIWIPDCPIATPCP